MRFGVYVAFHIYSHIRNEDTSTDCAADRYFKSKMATIENSLIAISLVYML